MLCFLFAERLQRRGKPISLVVIFVEEQSEVL